MLVGTADVNHGTIFASHLISVVKLVKRNKLNYPSNLI